MASFIRYKDKWQTTQREHSKGNGCHSLSLMWHSACYRFPLCHSYCSIFLSSHSVGLAVGTKRRETPSSFFSCCLLSNIVAIKFSLQICLHRAYYIERMCREQGIGDNVWVHLLLRIFFPTNPYSHSHHEIDTGSMREKEHNWQGGGWPPRFLYLTPGSLHKWCGDDQALFSTCNHP